MKMNSINTLDKVKKLLEKKFNEYQKEEIEGTCGSELDFSIGEKNAVEEIYIAIFGKEEFDNFKEKKEFRNGI